MDNPHPGEYQNSYGLESHAAYKFFPGRPRLREAGEQAVLRRCKHNTGLMFSYSWKLSASSKGSKESTRVPSLRHQESARKASQSRNTSGCESRSAFTGTNRSEGLPSSCLPLRRNMLSKPAVGKATICIRLLTMTHSGKGEYTFAGNFDGRRSGGQQRTTLGLWMPRVAFRVSTTS